MRANSLYGLYRKRNIDSKLTVSRNRDIDSKATEYGNKDTDGKLMVHRNRNIDSKLMDIEAEIVTSNTTTVKQTLNVQMT